MISDALLEVATAQAVTVTAVSSKSVDLGPNPVGPLAGRVQAVASIDTTFTIDSGTPTLQIQLITAIDGALTTSIAPVGAFPPAGSLAVADLAAGREPITIEVTRDLKAAQGLVQRYLGARFVVAGGVFDQGALTVGLQLHSAASDARIYPAGTDT